MASNAFSAAVCVLCVVVVPVVWADYCISYKDNYGVVHNAQQCGQAYCCGDCSRRSCCTDYRYRMSQSDQQRCQGSHSDDKRSRLSVILGSIFGTIFPVIVCVSVIVCCVAPCCLCYKKCRKGNQRQSTAMVPHHVVNTPDGPLNPSGYQPGYPNQPPYPGQPPYHGYQPVPGYGPSPSAPPPAYGGNAPSHIPVAFNQGQPMYSLQPSSQTDGAPPQPEEQNPSPFNPAYGPEP